MIRSYITFQHIHRDSWSAENHFLEKPVSLTGVTYGSGVVGLSKSVLHALSDLQHLC